MLTEGNVFHRGGGRVDTSVADRAVARLAEAQHGVVTRPQLLGAGLSSRAIERRSERGWLHRIHQGVYAVGHPRLTRDGRWMAAALACGPGAVLSHRDAAALWALLPSARATIDVTVPKRRRAPTGIQPHHQRIEPDEITTVAGIPTTTVARTLLDLAAVETQDRFERALDEAERRGLGDNPSLADLDQRYGPRRGRRKLHKARPDTTFTRSELEREFLKFLKVHGISQPQTNVTVLGYEVDAYWPDHNLVVELDGFAFHATRRSFDHDHERDRKLMRAGLRPLRITATQLSAETASDLRALTRG
jgi:very-short-patch-repair endonuclease